ncbi:hypothetical protein NQ315_006035, partial [Exocentrus adspersus]
VQSALPAIDTSPPPYRSHVAIKSKKQQKENERCMKIERDNFILLQKMEDIVKTSRIDNSWKTYPLRNYLNKISVYNMLPSDTKIDKYMINNDIKFKNRVSKCCATPTKAEDIKSNFISKTLPS